MMVTTTPVAIKIAAEATYKLDPRSRSMKDLSVNVQTPIENTTSPPILKTHHEHFLIRIKKNTHEYDNVGKEEGVFNSFSESFNHGDRGLRNFSQTTRL